MGKHATIVKKNKTALNIKLQNTTIYIKFFKSAGECIQYARKWVKLNFNNIFNSI